MTITVFFPFLTFAFILFILVLYSKKISVISFGFLFVLSVLMAWLPAFGGSTITDYPVYKANYDILTSQDLVFDGVLSSGSMEYGFLIAMFVFKSMGFSFVGFLFFLLIVENALFLIFIKDEKRPFLTFCLFIMGTLYVQEPNIIRQMFALSILTLSIKYVCKRDLLAFVSVVLLASFFHQSALIFLPFYFIYEMDNTKLVLFVLWMISLLFYILGAKINLAFIFDILSSYGIKYAYFYDSKYTIASDSLVILLSNLLQIGIFYFLFIKRVLDKRSYSVFILFTVGTILSNILVSLPILYRLSWYFTFFFMCIPPILIYYFNRIKKQYIGFTILLIFVAYNSIHYFNMSTTPVKVVGRIINPLSDIFM